MDKIKYDSPTIRPEEATPRPWKQDGLRIEDAQGRKVASGDSMDIRPIGEALANTALIVSAVNRIETLESACHAALHHIETPYHKRITSTSAIVTMLQKVLGEADGSLKWRHQ